MNRILLLMLPNCESMNIVGNKRKGVRNDAVNSQPSRKSCHEH